MTISLIDTSVFCNILRVPFKSQDSDRIISEVGNKIEKKEILLLPFATVFETGNHIAQNGSGSQKRECALRFIEEIKLAFRGDTPYRPTSFPEMKEVLSWIDEFPDSAMRGTGMADQSIIKEWEKACKQFKEHRVYIWSLDEHLMGYDKPGNFIFTNIL
ncbi:MAG TPA: hypothetical protein PLY36_06330 [Spirochaetota bacterium]|nr:hypothetical protein [Spirochaetota bacterium]